MRVQIVNKSSNPLPTYSTAYSAGMDIRANLKNDEGNDEIISIAPGERVLIPTGLYIQLPYGYEAQIRPRSGLALKYGITVLNTPGTIDADYRGEIGVCLINHGNDTFYVHHGDRIAQIVFAQVEQVLLTEVCKLKDTKRGDGGFGHTGIK
nr:MAG TPA: dUTPase [Crassvirales sp.]